eukprot:3197693-Pleurochrysis_carterae.AAC.1
MTPASFSGSSAPASCSPTSPTSVCHSSSNRCSALSSGCSAIAPPSTQTPAACASGLSTSGESVADMRFQRRPCAPAPFRLPTTNTSGIAASLDASRSVTGIEVTLPLADSSS